MNAFEEPWFSGNFFLSDVLSNLHSNNDNAHKILFTSSQNTTFSLRFVDRLSQTYASVKTIEKTIVVELTRLQADQKAKHCS